MSVQYEAIASVIRFEIVRIDCDTMLGCQSGSTFASLSIWRALSGL
jgi:hypothetical protein